MMPDAPRFLPVGEQNLMRFAVDYPQARPALDELLQAFEEKQRLANTLKTNVRTPSKDFEIKSGLEGVSVDWKFPAGLEPLTLEREIYSVPLPELDRTVDPNYLTRMGKPVPPRVVQEAVIDIGRRIGEANLPGLNQRFDALVKENPALAAIEVDRKDPVRVSQALIGVTSQYTVEDINYFMKGGGNNSLSVEDGIKRTVVLILAGGMGWAGSPQTLDNLYNRIMNPKIITLEDVVNGALQEGKLVQLSDRTHGDFGLRGTPAELQEIRTVLKMQEIMLLDPSSDDEGVLVIPRKNGLLRYSIQTGKPVIVINPVNYDPRSGDFISVYGWTKEIPLVDAPAPAPTEPERRRKASETKTENTPK